MTQSLICDRGPIYSTAGTDDKVKFIENHGATKGINYKTQDFAKEVATLTNNEGVSVVIDFIGASYWEKNIASLAKEGRMVLLGLMGGAKTETPLNLLPILFKRLRIEGPFRASFPSFVQKFTRAMRRNDATIPLPRVSVQPPADLFERSDAAAFRSSSRRRWTRYRHSQSVRLVRDHCRSRGDGSCSQYRQDCLHDQVGITFAR